MSKLQEYRAAHPQYDHIPDGRLAQALHGKYYSDMPLGQFADSVGLSGDGFREMVGLYEAGGRETTGRTQAENHTPPSNGIADPARAAFQGVTLGAGDEIVAAGAAAVDALRPGGSTYSEHLGAERQRLDDYRNRAPVASTVAEIGGAIAGPGAAAGGLVRGGSLMARSAKAGGVAAVEGGVYGFNAGEGGASQRVDNARTTAAISGVIGAAAPGAGQAIGGAIARRNTQSAINRASRNAPSDEALRQTAQDAYQAAEATGAVIAAPSYQRFVTDLAQEVQGMGGDKVLQPRAMRALEIMGKDAGQTVTLQRLENLRRIAGGAAQGTLDPSDQRIAGHITSKIDDYVDNLVTADLASGAADNLGPELQRAREMWGRMRRSQEIQRLISRAELAASGFENGLRVEFRNALKGRGARKFSQAEREAMRAVVEGSTTGNILRRIGRFSFGAGAQHNSLQATLGVGAGGVMGGPVGMVAAPVVGYAAQRGSERMTSRAAQRVRDLAANGGLEEAISRLSQEEMDQLEALLTRGGRVGETVNREMVPAPSLAQWPR